MLTQESLPRPCSSSVPANDRDSAHVSIPHLTPPVIPCFRPYDDSTERRDTDCYYRPRTDDHRNKLTKLKRTGIVNHGSDIHWKRVRLDLRPIFRAPHEYTSHEESPLIEEVYSEGSSLAVAGRKPDLGSEDVFDRLP